MQVYLNRGVQAEWAIVFCASELRSWVCGRTEGKPFASGIGDCADSMVHLLCDICRDTGWEGEKGTTEHSLRTVRET